MLELILIIVSDVADLEKKESILDKLIADCTKSLRELTEGPDNTRYPFMISSGHVAVLLV